MVVVPAPTMVTALPKTVATLGFVLVKVNAPALLDTGSERKNGRSDTFLEILMSAMIVGAMVFTVSVDRALAPVKSPAAACVAVIVAVPAPIIVTVFPATVATDGLLERNVKVPLLLEVGDNTNALSP